MVFASTLEAARNGSGQALGTILESCRGYLAAVAIRRLPHKLQGRVRPSTLVQETYLRACRQFGQFRGQSEQQMLAWLRQIMLHCLFNLLRQPEFRATLQDLPHELAGPHASPPQEAADRECGRALDAALDRLPAYYRLAVQLRHFDRLSFKEIGNVLNCTPEAARKLWTRALVRLGEKLERFQ
jgi:RNA polymerase sigma-70 factor (ECF subfamily)